MTCGYSLCAAITESLLLPLLLSGLPEADTIKEKDKNNGEEEQTSVSLVKTEEFILVRNLSIRK